MVLVFFIDSLDVLIILIIPIFMSLPFSLIKAAQRIQERILLRDYHIPSGVNKELFVRSSYITREEHHDDIVLRDFILSMEAVNPTGVESQVSVHDMFEDFDLSLI